MLRVTPSSRSQEQEQDLDSDDVQQEGVPAGQPCRHSHPVAHADAVEVDGQRATSLAACGAGLAYGSGETTEAPAPSGRRCAGVGGRLLRCSQSAPQELPGEPAAAAAAAAATAAAAAASWQSAVTAANAAPHTSSAPSCQAARQQHAWPAAAPNERIRALLGVRGEQEQPLRGSAGGEAAAGAARPRSGAQPSLGPLPPPAAHEACSSEPGSCGAPQPREAAPPRPAPAAPEPQPQQLQQQQQQQLQQQPHPHPHQLQQQPHPHHQQGPPQQEQQPGRQPPREAEGGAGLCRAMAPVPAAPEQPAAAAPADPAGGGLGLPAAMLTVRPVPAASRGCSGSLDGPDSGERLPAEARPVCCGSDGLLPATAASGARSSSQWGASAVLEACVAALKHMCSPKRLRPPSAAAVRRHSAPYGSGSAGLAGSGEGGAEPARALGCLPRLRAISATESAPAASGLDAALQAGAARAGRCIVELLPANSTSLHDQARMSDAALYVRAPSARRALVPGSHRLRRSST